MLIVRGLFRNVIPAQTRRLATAWKVTPAYGTALRLTSHDVELTIHGEVYTPMGGADPSTARRQGQLREHDREFRGVITSDRFTAADLIAGRWNGANVTEYLLDWSLGWADEFRITTYRIAELSFDGTLWRASSVGLVQYLRGARGDIYGRHCRHEWGVVRPDGDGCPVVAATFTQSGVVATGFGDGGKKVQIRASGLSGSFADGYFALGKLAVTTGANAGQVRDVKRYTLATRELELQYPLPVAMAIGDTFSVTAGCDRRAATCRDKFNVFETGFGGFDTMPGTDFVLGIKPAA